MRRFLFAFPFALTLASFLLSISAAHLSSQALDTNYARDPGQAIDQKYTDQIVQYTTDKSFLSPLVDYLPASKTVPTPEKVLGDVSGAPNMLPYAEDVYKYFRMLEAASPRVKVFTIGHSEEGREMIAAGHCRPRIAGRGQGKQRAAGAAGRPADDRHGRRQGKRADRQVISGLLHYGHDPLDRNRRADGADGDGLSAGRRRLALHQVHPLAHDCADYAGGGSGWPRPHGRHLQMAPGAPGRSSPRGWSIGATTSRTTTIAMRWA